MFRTKSDDDDDYAYKICTHMVADGADANFYYIYLYIIIFYERWERPRRVCAKL